MARSAAAAMTAEVDASGNQASSGPLPGSWLRAVRRRMLTWYGEHARDLPWRETREPYPIWVSEIMLQQTQVATVRGYWERFLARFPTLADLATAPEEEVLRQWEGLGYYRRARQMQRAAQVMVAEHDGEFPHDPAAVRALPGIGRYTAGAVLSIAFDAREPILEANSIRLLARLLAIREDPTRGAVQRRLWDVAEQLLPESDVGAFNQSLMEIGSVVCTPRGPDCSGCPVRPHCAAHAQGLVAEIPAAGKRMQYEDRREAAVVILRSGKILLRRCEPGERWAGLWDFPRFAVTAARGERLDDELIAGVRDQTGLRIPPPERLTTLKHSVTRYRITLHCHLTEQASGRLKRDAPLRWQTPAELAELPLSVTGRKIAQLLATK